MAIAVVGETGLGGVVGVFELLLGGVKLAPDNLLFFFKEPYDLDVDSKLSINPELS